ncbi:MAG: hypothetical protein U0936_04405 [Planctomycetaceae bacterium]
MATEARPNIVVIVSDDLGYADLGYLGGKDIPTPHVDQLLPGIPLYIGICFRPVLRSLEQAC